MSANEFVVVQVWTAYALTDGNDGRWLDYSRGTAGQAQLLLCSPPKSERTGKRMTLRARHWITGEELNAAQLERMRVLPERWESRAPEIGADVALTRRQADILSEAMLNALLETDESQWTTYTDALDAFCAVATPGHLEMWRDAKGI